MGSQAPPLILGIETSCDDTACALLDGAGRVLASAVSSQLEAHRPYGGVVPEIASREHLRNWPAVSAAAFESAGVALDDVGAIAVTRGPGLVGSLLVGLSIGRAIAWGRGLPFHAVHHLEGHVFSPFLGADGEPASTIPASFTALVVSGGHTSLLAVDGGEIQSLAETRDDAMGEVFDKVGKRLGLAYPQGPKVDQLAETGDASRYAFRVRGHPDELFFSFSGLKTQVIRELEALEGRSVIPRDARWSDPDEVPAVVRDLLAGFRVAAVRQLENRLRHLHARRPLELLAVSGGVAANRLLRRELARWAEENGVALRLVPLVYAGDNAAMIAFAALLRQRRGRVDDPRDVVVQSRIPFRSEPGLS